MMHVLLPPSRLEQPMNIMNNEEYIDYIQYDYLGCSY